MIYIPDCAGWGEYSGERATEFLLKAIISAFDDDSEVLNRCKSSEVLEEGGMKELLKVKQFYFVFFFCSLSFFFSPALFCFISLFLGGIDFFNSVSAKVLQ